MHRQGRRLESRARTRGATRLAPVSRQEHPHVQLVAIRFDLFEEALDPGELAVPGVDELALVRVQGRIRLLRIDTMSSDGLDEFALVSPPRRVGPGLNGSRGQGAARVRHDESL